jgi:hypothetical protein
MMKAHHEPTKSLDRVSTQAAANVRREIQGWFAQCRKVTFESAILIRCPDRETVLAYQDPGKQRPAPIKRLKEMGVLVSEDDRRNTPAPCRGRRGGGW